MRPSVQFVLGIAVVAIAIITLFLRRDYVQRNSEFLPGMVVSVPYNAQDENSNFADGKTLQRPDTNDVPRGFFPYHYRATAEDALRAGNELTNPISDTNIIALQRGAFVFSTYCQPCHGAGGLGDGLVVQRGFPPPPSLLAEKAMKIKDGKIFHIVTYGQGNMPSLVPQVVRLDRWRAILYVRSLQKKNLSSGR